MSKGNVSYGLQIAISERKNRGSIRTSANLLKVSNRNYQTLLLCLRQKKEHSCKTQMEPWKRYEEIYAREDRRIEEVVFRLGDTEITSHQSVKYRGKVFNTSKKSQKIDPSVIHGSGSSSRLLPKC